MTPADSDPERWLVPTRQLDLSHPKLRITAHKLTQSRQSLPERAAALHAFVRRMPFAASADSGALTAGQVLRAGEGDCHSKGLLFTALCRAAGLPARLWLYTLRPRFLDGLLPHGRGPDLLPHVVAEVRVERRWLRTDGYVVDPALFAQAKHHLRDTGGACGWGIVRDAQGAWDGRADCIQQFAPADVLAVQGPFDEPDQFRDPARARAGWHARLQYAAGVHLLNRRVAEVRRFTPAAAQPS
jgi:hypothetical protein